MNINSGSDPLTQYKLQLLSVEEAIKIASADNLSELQDLKEKLTEVISLLGGTPLQSSGSGCKGETKSQKEDEIHDAKDDDDEFLRFQREIGAMEGGFSSRAEDEDGEDDVVQEEFLSVLSSMEGNKCRAPFMREWGEKAFHNALIFSTDVNDQDISDVQEVQVKVMFCNPTCDPMRPCPYFLDGHCKFPDDKCRYSHGHSVKFCELEEYVLPDYSHVQRDSRCLAKFKDGLWYPAVVENCLGSQKYCVKYSGTGSADTLAAHDLLPLGDFALSDDESSSDSSDEDVVQKIDVAKQSREAGVEINYEVVAASSPIGTWEQHTKGIGSKLMAKMGYVWGQGLGRNSDGRLEPVEAIVLPKGKSLDKCAEIREYAGLESVEERFSSEQIREEQRAKNIEKKQSPESSVFAFLNKNVSVRGDCHSKRTEDIRKRSFSDTSENSGNKSRDSNLNFEMYSVGEAIKRTRKEMSRLQQSVNRNSDRKESSACSLMKQKLSVQGDLLQTLEAKERRISDEINRKKNHKKIAVF